MELFLIPGELFGDEQVDDMTADFIISQLLILDAEDQKKDITLIINSPGGSVTAGMCTWFIVHLLWLHMMLSFSLSI